MRMMKKRDANNKSTTHAKQAYFSKDSLLTKNQNNSSVYGSNYGGSVMQNEYMLNKLQNQKRVESQILNKQTFMGLA